MTKEEFSKLNRKQQLWVTIKREKKLIAQLMLTGLAFGVAQGIVQGYLENLPEELGE